ncbi:C4-dicarboxylate TRAP transporter large permease protein DctM [wastewater metagenome]|uniref:C4-dicarboxylate TRAP transporter large permease protein DctM n=2 Tax=unclassified sequences TaxID=12908 RepID=A0A5B8RFC6_9ZZZZ|nr:TRAP transporter large permease [Arhodomonas sp. KWT]QEA06703.1 C4-dicarboxylate TRAP transporter large permease protein DctM [uncultured organism]
MLDPLTAAALSVPLIFILMALGVPVFAALGVAGLFSVVSAESGAFAYSQLKNFPYHHTAVYLLTVVPLFILLGNFAHHAGVGRSLFGVARRWVGHWPGGLAMASILTSAGFAATSGSSVATAATVGSMALPEMRNAGYDRRLAAGAVAAGGVLGVLIPPSVLLVFYAALTEVSAGKMLVAGVIPGLISTGVFLGGIWLLSTLRPGLSTVYEKASWRERIVYLKDAWQLGLLIVVVIGGIYSGWVTPTEAAAVGAVAAMLLLLFAKGTGASRLSQIWGSCRDTLGTTVMIIMTIVGAGIFSFSLSLAQVPQLISEWVVGLPLPGLAIVGLFLLIYFPLGMFLDAFSMLVITLPIMFPAVMALGFDPIWFGILAIKMCEIGLITPPIGLNVYVIAGLDERTSLPEVFQGAGWFIAMELVGTAVLFFFPVLTTWLPNTM